MTNETTAPVGIDGNPRRSTDDLIDQTVESVFSAVPAGLSVSHSAAAAGRVLRTAIRKPHVVAKHTTRLWLEQVKVATGLSDVAPAPKDGRFRHEAFQEHPVHRRLAQSYLAWNRTWYQLLDDLDLDEKSLERARFISGIITEALAPTNTLLGNPAAMEKARETRGRSLVDGFRHWLYDVRNNGGLPSMVDTRPFVMGETIARTPGQVVFRNEILEVIQYAPTTETVHERPVLIVPPQINRYYVLDLAKGRSMVEHAVGEGQQVFMVSWRNPGPEHRDWDLDAYLTAMLEAIDATREITGSDDVNLVGTCAGGITVAALLSHMAATGDDRVNAVTYLVTILDWSVLSTVGTLISRPVLNAAVRRARKDGLLRGADLASLFAWLRPNDLIWNYWINNYLMGDNPPSFDVLAWNVDSTNLPAGLFADFVQFALDDAMATGMGEALGTPLALGKVDRDAYVVAGQTDHITPWQACYETTRLQSGSSTFVLSTSGHIQALVNPPGGRKASYRLNDDGAGLDPEDWLDGSTEHPGTWWTHWTEWLAERAGDQVPAPTTRGSDAHPPIVAAPGRYVRE
jgi:polyhydroxyalkanoate synthase subunit PhaC